MSEAKLAVDRLPNSSIAATCLSQTLMADGRYEEALVESERALRLDPLNHIAWMILGLTYFRMGQIENTATTCKKAVELSPRYLPAHMVLASAYSLGGREREARAAVIDILKIKPGFSAKDYPMLFDKKTAADIEAILNELLNERLNQKAESIE
jgi:tetratricopeptide (TPR) repeat protein